MLRSPRSFVLCFLGVLTAPCLGQSVEPRLQPAPFQLPSDFETKTREYLQARVKVDQFTGIALVAVEGKPVFRESYGLANRDYDIPNTPKTKFRIGSLTKQFTSVAILMLEEQEKLKITDPVGKYLPDCPKAWSEVTLHQLMSHTGGIPEHTTVLFLTPGASARPQTPQGIIDLVKDRPLDFTPGEKWQYSNTGYDLLGMVIEAVTKKSYAEFMHEAVFQRAGLSDTGVERNGMVLKNRATGYGRSGGEVVAAQYVHMSLPYAAGAMYSTADDLVLWDRVLAGDKLIGKAATEKLLTPVKNNYACGVGVARKFDRARHGHGGGLPGFTSYLARYPESGLCIVVFDNAGHSFVPRMADDLAAIAFGEKYKLPGADG